MKMSLFGISSYNLRRVIGKRFTTNLRWVLYVTLFVIVSGAHAVLFKEEPVLPTHTSPSAPNMTFLVISFYILERILSSSFAKTCFSSIVTYLRRRGGPDSPFERAYQAARAAATHAEARFRAPGRRPPFGRGGGRGFFRKEEPPTIIVTPALPGNRSLPPSVVSEQPEEFAPVESAEESTAGSEPLPDPIPPTYCDQMSFFEFLYYLNLLAIEFLRELMRVPFDSEVLLFRFYVICILYVCNLCFTFSRSWYLLPAFFPTRKTVEQAYERVLQMLWRDPKEYDNSLAPDDASTAASTISTLSEGKVVEIDQLKSNLLKTTTTKSVDVATAYVQQIESTLGKNSCAVSVMKFLFGMYFVPEGNTAVVAAHYASQIHTLLREAFTLYPEKVQAAISYLSVVTAQMLGSPLICESAGEFSFGNNWTSAIMAGFEKLEFFKDAPVGKLMSTLLSLICTVPLLFDKIANVDTWAKKWRAITDAISLAGTSMSTVVRTMIGVQQELTELSEVGTSNTLMSVLMSGAPIFKEFVECRDKFGKLRTGLITMNLVDLEAFTRRCERLAKQSKDRVRGNSTIHDMNLAKECTNLADDLTTWTIAQKERVVPFVFSFDGEAGNGKSTFARQLFPSMHEWFGIKDLMSISTPTLTTKTDEVSTNRTTCIFLDDTANSKRKTERSSMDFVIDNVNNSYREIPKADLPDKGKHVYRNSFLCLADNDPKRGVDEDLRCPQAGLRRFGCCMEVVVRPEYDNGSGGLMELPEGTTLRMGEAQRFRPYYWVKSKNSPSRQQNVFKDDGFVDAMVAVKWLKDQAQRHFNHQRLRVANSSAAAQECVCISCGLVPFSQCDCLERPEDYMDAVEPEKLIEESNYTPLARCEAESEEEISVAAPASVVGDPRVGRFDRFFIRYKARVETLGVGYSHLVRQFEDNSLTIYCITFCVIIAMGCGWFFGPIFAAAVLVLSAIANEVRRQIVIRAARYAGVLVPEMIAAHTASLRSTCVEFSEKLFKFTLSTIALNFALKYIRYSIRKCIEAPRKQRDKADRDAYAMACQADSPNPLPPDEWWSRVDWVEKPVIRPKEKTTAEAIERPPTESTGQVLQRSPEEIEAISASKRGFTPIWSGSRFEPPATDAPTETNTICLDDIERIAIGNTWSGGFRPKWHPDVPAQDVHMTFVCGGYALTVGHSQWYKGELLPSVFESDNETFILPAGATYQFAGLDLQMIDLNNVVAPRKDIRKFLLNEFPAGVVCARKMIIKDHAYCFEGLTMSPVIGTYDLNSRHVRAGCSRQTTPQLLFRSTKQNCVETRPGYCGMPYILDSKAKAIFAIHCSGDSSLVSEAIPVTREMIDEAIATLTLRGNLRKMERLPACLTAGRAQLAGEPDQRHPIFKMPNDGRKIVYEKWVPRHFSTRSALICNPHLQAAKELLGLKILKVRPKMSVSEAGTPVLESATRPKPFGDMDLLFAATQVVIAEIVDPVMASYEPAEHETRPLTYSEILNGVEGHFPCLDLSKSSGIGGKKKDYVVGELPDRSLTSEMLADCDVIEDMIRQYKNPCVPAVACIKDEPIAPHKTARLFYNPPMQLYMVIAKYMKNVLDVITKNAIGFKTAIGLDPVGPEWEEFVRMFAAPTFAENCFDLDFEKFDTTQNIKFRNMINVVCHRVAMHLYTDDDDLYMLQRAMALGDETPIDFLGVVVFLEDLLVSGMIFTAHKNGLVIIILMAASYIKFCNEKKLDRAKYPFSSHFAVGGLGDDSVGAVSDEFRKMGWSQQHLVDVAAAYGMRLTAADKTKDLRFKTFPECEFLKRHYNWHPDLQINVSVASPKSYLRPFHFHQPSKELTEAEYQCEQTRTVLLEAFYGGRECYEEVQRRLHAYFDACPKLYKDPSLMLTYDEVLEERRPGYTPQRKLFDVEDTGMRLLREYDALEHLPFTAAESEEEQTKLISTIEGEEQESSGYVANDPAHLPINNATIADKFIGRRQVVREVLLPLLGLDTFCPQVEMMKQKIYATRATNTAHLVTGIRLTFVTTAPGTVTGCLLACINYSPDREGPLLINEQSVRTLMSQRPHIQMRIGEQSNVWQLDVPFVSPVQAHLAHDQNEELKPTVSIVQLVPLTTSGAAANPITIRIYGELIEPSLFGATATHTATAESSTAELLEELVADREVQRMSGVSREDNVLANYIASIRDLPPIPHALEYAPIEFDGATSLLYDPVSLVSRNTELEEWKDLFKEIINFECPLRTYLLDLCFIPRNVPTGAGYCYLLMFHRCLQPLVAAFHGAFPDASEFVWTQSLMRPLYYHTTLIQDDTTGIGHIVRGGNNPRRPFDHTTFQGTLGAKRGKAKTKELTRVQKERLRQRYVDLANHQAFLATRLANWKTELYSLLPANSSPRAFVSSLRYVPAGLQWIANPGYCYVYAFDERLRSILASYYGPFPLMRDFGWVKDADPKILLEVVIIREGVKDGKPLWHVVEPAKYATLYTTTLAEVVDADVVVGGVMSEPLSSKIARVANVATDVLNLPAISASPLAAMRTPVEILRQFGNALQLMGFSKPAALSGRPSSFFCNAAGEDQADVLAVQPLCQVSPGLPTSSGDEMNFATITRKWTFVGQFGIDPTPMVGRIEYTINVTPQIIVGSRPAACAAPGLFHSFFRGSMEYRFEVFCPLLVSVRLAIFYDPLGPDQADLGSEPKLAEEDFLEHYIWDSSNSQVLETTVGYSSRFPALRTFHPNWESAAEFDTQWLFPTQYQEECHNGYIMIKLVDYVNGGNVSPMPIYVNVWARAGPDMQWGRFEGKLPGNYSMQAVNSPPPEMTEKTCVAGLVVPVTTCESGPITTAPFLTPPKETPQPTVVQMASQFPSKLPSTTAPSTTAPTKAPTGAPSTKTPTNAPSTKAPTVKPTPAPSTAQPTTKTPTLLPTPVPTTAQPTTKAPTLSPTTAAPTTPSPTPSVKARGAPGLICGSNFNGVVQGGYWFTTDNVNRGEMALAYTQNGTVRFGCVVADQFGNRRVGVVCRVLSGTATIGGVNVPETTTTLEFIPPSNVAQPDIFLLDIVVSPGGELRIYSGVVYTAHNVALRTMPVDGPAISLGGTPEVFARNRLTDWYFPSDLTAYAQPVQVATITWIGTLILSWDGGSETTTSTTWARRTTGYAAGLRIRCGDATSYIYSVTYIRTANENAIENHSPTRRLRAEAAVVEEATVQPTAHHFGGPSDMSEYFIRGLMGEQILSFRELLKIPFPTVTFQPANQGEYTSISEIDVPANATLENTSLFNFLLHSFHAWRGGIVYHYVLAGDGMVEVTRAIREDNFTPFVMGDSFSNAYSSPRLSVVFPWQEPVLFSNGVTLPSIVKVVKITKFSAHHLRVREFRSTAEDFSFHYFRGLPRLRKVNP